MSGVTTSAAVEVHGDVGGKVVVPGGLVVAVSGHRHLLPGSEGWVEAELERHIEPPSSFSPQRSQRSSWSGSRASGHESRLTRSPSTAVPTDSGSLVSPSRRRTATTASASLTC